MSILPVIAATSSGADDVPKRFAFERYQVMMDRSPFAVATAVVAPAATPDFAKDLYVANAAKSPDGDMVTIASSSDKNFQEIPDDEGTGGRLQRREHRVVGQSRRDQGDNQQGRKICHAHFQSSPARATRAECASASGHASSAKSAALALRFQPKQIFNDRHRFRRCPVPRIRGVIPRNPQQQQQSENAYPTAAGEVERLTGRLKLRQLDQLPQSSSAVSGILSGPAE